MKMQILIIIGTTIILKHSNKGSNANNNDNNDDNDECIR